MVDTGTHVLRLMAAGAFDRCPDLKIVIGHVKVMGWDLDENPLLVDDSMGYSYQPYPGYQVVLTGMLRYHGGEDQYRFEPIKDAGIEQQ